MNTDDLNKTKKKYHLSNKELFFGFSVLGLLFILLVSSLVYRFFFYEEPKVFNRATWADERESIPNNPNFNPDSNYKTMQLSIRENDISTLKAELENGADPNAQGRFYETMMHWSVGISNIDAARTLQDYGGKINARDNQGRTPLYWAISSGTPETVRKLLEMGANPNIQDIYGRTPLMHAEFRERKEIIAILKPVTTLYPKFKEGQEPATSINK